MRIKMKEDRHEGRICIKCQRQPPLQGMNNTYTYINIILERVAESMNGSIGNTATTHVLFDDTDCVLFVSL